MVIERIELSIQGTGYRGLNRVITLSCLLDGVVVTHSMEASEQMLSDLAYSERFVELAKVKQISTK